MTALISGEMMTELTAVYYAIKDDLLKQFYNLDYRLTAQLNPDTANFKICQDCGRMLHPRTKLSLCRNCQQKLSHNEAWRLTL